jgi:hypothetical protein
VTFNFQFENTVELNILSERVGSRRFCVKSRRSHRLRQITSSIASIASFASNRVVDCIVCVKSRRQSRRSRRLRQMALSIASLDRAANRVVGSRRKSRRWIASFDRVERVVISA